MLFDVFSKLDQVNIYTKDTRGVGMSINERVITSFGLKTASDYVGRTDMDLPLQETYAPAWMENDRRIMANGVGEMLLEVCNCAGTITYFRSYKMPLLGHEGKVIGLTGFSIPITEEGLAPITKQQTACLRLLAMGLTHKQIGNELGLSAKTVEHYLDAVKLKLNCKSRSDLIMQAIERGLVGVF